MSLRTILFLALLGAALGCERNTVVNQGVPQGGSGGQAGAEQGGAGGTPLPACPQATPPAGKLGRPVVRVQKATGACLWIDQHEVTWDEFSQFIPQSAGTADEACLPEMPQDPDEACAAPLGSAAERKALPVSCVSWCDAAAFCRWEGKQLCHGEQYTSSAEDAGKSEWYAACASSSERAYPYGTSYDGTVCNGQEGKLNKPVTAGSMTGCATPDGVLDLSGNVAEWTDECSSTETLDATCLTRGGSYDSASGALGCRDAKAFKRTTKLPTVGFRCCAP